MLNPTHPRNKRIQTKASRDASTLYNAKHCSGVGWGDRLKKSPTSASHCIVIKKNVACSPALPPKGMMRNIKLKMFLVQFFKSGGATAVKVQCWNGNIIKISMVWPLKSGDQIR